MACHQDMPDGNLAVSLLSHVKEVSGMKVDTYKHNELVNGTLNKAAWAQFVIALLAGFGGFYLIIVLVRRKKRRR